MYSRLYHHDACITFNESFLNSDEIQPFDYTIEDNICLFIDAYYNTSLREKYPTILKIEREISSMQVDNPDFLYPHLGYSTPIIVIGTLRQETY